MDILNPFGDEHVESAGEKYVRLAGELVKVVQTFGGPKLNQDAVATILGDVLEWFSRLK